MVNVFIIHGSYGSPEENWIPWLKMELEKLKCKVFVPRFPTPQNQTLRTWLNVFEDYKSYLNGDSLVMGHSIGPAFLLNIIEKRNKPIKAAFFVSGFTGSLNNPTFDKLNSSFSDKEFDWQKIKENCAQFYVFHGDNDPYVPLQKAQDLAKHLGVDVILIKRGGHLNAEAGYTTFDLLLQKMKNEL